MNYRHAFHAGNHADVLKHSILALALGRMTAKPKPLIVIDLFAGAGRYDLALDERALRTNEAAEGVGRALSGEPSSPLKPYAATVAALNRPGEHRIIPGSPLVALQGMRAGDRFFGVELHPEEFERLNHHLCADKRVKLFQEDGWRALASFLPPTPRRGIVLIDPPFEKPGEHARLVGALATGLKRWASGVFLLWRPIKDLELDARHVAEAAAVAGETPLLDIRLLVAPADAGGLIGSGLMVANPPYGFADDVRALASELSDRLTRPGALGAVVESLVAAR